MSYYNILKNELTEDTLNKYIPEDLKKEQKEQVAKIILERRAGMSDKKTPLYNKELKKSSYTKEFNKTFDYLENKEIDELSKFFNIDEEILNKVMDRGLKAWATSGSRLGVNQFQWGYARVYKFIMNVIKYRNDEKIPTGKGHDYDLIKESEDDELPLLIDVNEINKDKRFIAVFSDGDKVKFGQTKPKIGTFIDHQDKELKENYIKRHKKDLKTDDYKRPGYLSMFLLWNKKTLKESFKDFNKRIQKDLWDLPKI